MNPAQAERKKNADLYMDAVRAALGVFFFRAATITEDREENTDLRFLFAHDIRVAVRVRTPKMLKRALSTDPDWLQQVTFRSGSEVHKMFGRDLGNYFFYAFGTDDLHLHSWILIDLNILRRCAAVDQILGRKYFVQHIDAGDPFEALDMLTVDPACIIAASDNHPCKALIKAQPVSDPPAAKPAASVEPPASAQSAPSGDTGYGFEGFDDYNSDLTWGEEQSRDPIPKGDYTFEVTKIVSKSAVDYTVWLSVKGASPEHAAFVGRVAFENLHFGGRSCSCGCAGERLRYVKKFALAAGVALPERGASIIDWLVSTLGFTVAGTITHKPKNSGGVFENVSLKPAG